MPVKGSYTRDYSEMTLAKGFTSLGLSSDTDCKRPTTNFSPNNGHAGVAGIAIHRGLKNLGEKSHTGWSPVTRTKMYRNAKDERAICKIVVSRLKSGPVLQSKE